MLVRRLDAPASRSAFNDKAAQCADLLEQARGLVLVCAYGAWLNEIIDHTYDVFADIDEILITLSPLRDHDAFASVASLHRRLQEIQSLIPRSRRGR